MPKVTCIIPAYNEEKNIQAVLDVVLKAKKEKIIDEIIVVSDGSKDKTAKIARDSNADQILELKKNVGKGGAVIEGLKKSSGEIMLFLDADLINLTMKHILDLIKPIINSNAEMVIGFFPDDFLQQVTPHFSGQRAFARKALEDIIHDRRMYKSRHHFEILLTRFFSRQHKKIVYIPLEGLNHILKKNKYNLYDYSMHAGRFFFGLPLYYKRYIALIISLILIFVSYLLFFSPIKIIGINLLNLSIPTKDDKILVIASHPDDEAIGAGGYIADATKNGANVKVVIVTNGDANKWSAGVENKTILPDRNDFIKEGNTRENESKSALALLGVSKENIYFLGFPDKELKNLLMKNWSNKLTSPYTKWTQNQYEGTFEPGVPYTGRDLENSLAEIITDFKPNIIITHNSNDENSDHVSVKSFVTITIDQLENRQVIQMPKIYSFLVHFKISQFPHPYRYKFNDPLYPPKKIEDSCNWTSYSLSSETELKKKEAINIYESQMDSPSLKFLLTAFIRTNELFCEEK